MGKRTKTRHPGVYRLEDGRYAILATTGDGGRKRTWRTLPHGLTLNEAAIERSALVDSLKTGGGSIRPLGLQEYARTWLAEMTVRPSTRARYQGALVDHILPELGHLALQDINRGTLQRWCLSASKRTRPDGEPYAHQTVLGWWRVAKQLLQDAAAEHDLPDPTRRVRPPSTQIAKRRKRNALTRGQLAQVLEAVHEVHPEWYAEVYTLAYTGMRPGELYALQWRDIDLANGWIHIRRAVWRDKVDKTKTGSERRAPLTDAIREALKRKQRGLPSALVFPAANGAHRLPQSLLTMLKRLCKQYGLPHTTPYTFRYTFRTLMRDSGAPDELVRAIQGHADPKMGINYYRVDMDTAADAVAAMSAPPSR